jgi:hypothetical protein
MLQSQHLYLQKKKQLNITRLYKRRGKGQSFQRLYCRYSTLAQVLIFLEKKDLNGNLVLSESTV